MRMKQSFNDVYQFKISLKRSKPLIWRRIQVPETYSFWDLHVAIQDAMGWYDCHLHEFQMVNPKTGEKANIGIPDEFYDREILPEWKQNISDYVSLENSAIDYEYDFGDGWKHKIQLEKILPREQGVTYPRCLKGKRACPPEDCGGVWGYEEFLEAIKDPDHPEHREKLAWLIGDWDDEEALGPVNFHPEHFDPDEVEFDDPKKRFRQAIREGGIER